MTTNQQLQFDELAAYHRPAMADAICWNGMTLEQQRRLSSTGRILKADYGGGPCPNKASVAVQAGNCHGPRWYCAECANDPRD